jgi:hypothetical protein
MVMHVPVFTLMTEKGYLLEDRPIERRIASMRADCARARAAHLLIRGFCTVTTMYIERTIAV